VRERRERRPITTRKTPAGSVENVIAEGPGVEEFGGKRKKRWGLLIFEQGTLAFRRPWTNPKGGKRKCEQGRFSIHTFLTGKGF